MAAVELTQASGLLNIEVVCGPADRCTERVALKLAPGATLADALQASGFLAQHGWRLDDPELAWGIWMKAKPLDTVLREQDRVEIYRPLKVDPKEARRQRYRKQPAKGSGRPAA